MTDWIESLDDETARRVLGVYASAQPDAGEYETEDTDAIREGLIEAFEGVSPSAEGGEGELARQALRVLAQDPQEAKRLRAVAEGPAAKMMSLGAGVMIVVGALVVLQTRIKFKRDTRGRITFEIEKKAASDGLLRSLVQKLLPFLGRE